MAAQTELEKIMSYLEATDKNFAELLGKTLVRVTGAAGDEEMRFVTVDGDAYVLCHDQNCCESVSVESIVGDMFDLLGAPITMAEEISSTDGEDNAAKPAGWRPGEYEDSYTWTFYKLATRKGYVDIRWYGTSNGYYSESVDFKLLPRDAK